MSQKLTDLQKKKAALEAQHKAELGKLAAHVKKEKIRLNKIERNDDTRRKVLAGATALEWAKRSDDFAAKFREELQTFLVRNKDRVLFDLPLTEDEKQ